MPRRRTLAGLLLAASYAGSRLYRRRAEQRRERVHVHYADGSTATLVQGAPEADRLLALARDVLYS